MTKVVFISALLLIMAFFSPSSIAEARSELSVRAMLEPVQEAVVSSELAAQITAINVRNGEAFNKGDPLMLFDCSLLQANLNEAQADHGSALVQLDNKRDLFRLKSAGQLEVRLAELDVDRMKARLDSAKTMKERCTLKAPFSGRVVDVLVNPFESVAVSDELISLLDDSQLEVSLVLPSSWLSWIKTRVPFSLKVDETGQRYAGYITRLGARVDAVSQSVRVTGQLNKTHSELMAGMSGTVWFGNNTDKNKTSK